PSSHRKRNDICSRRDGRELTAAAGIVSTMNDPAHLPGATELREAYLPAGSGAAPGSATFCTPLPFPRPPTLNAASLPDHWPPGQHDPRAALRLSASGNRAVGSLAKQRRITASRSAGTSGRRRDNGSGASYMCAAISFMPERPANGGSPISRKYPTAPTL